MLTCWSDHRRALQKQVDCHLVGGCGKGITATTKSSEISAKPLKKTPTVAILAGFCHSEVLYVQRAIYLISLVFANHLIGQNLQKRQHPYPGIHVSLNIASLLKYLRVSINLIYKCEGGGNPQPWC